MILDLLDGLWRPLLYGALGIALIKFIPRYMAFKRRVSRGRF